MRIAAGILMIIGAIIGWIAFIVVKETMEYPEYSPLVSPYRFLLSFLLEIILPIFGAIFVIVGGICTLKRRAWKVCFTSSILLLPVPFLALYLVVRSPPSPAEIISVFFCWIIPTFLVAILPIIFVCLRKREWES